MKKAIYESENFRLLALNSAKIALSAYKAGLKTKMLAADAVMAGLKKIEGRDYPGGFAQNAKTRTLPAVIPTEKDKLPAVKNSLPPAEKENDNMKQFLSALAVFATAGAVLGAAGYYVYKKAKDKNYDDLLYTDEMGEDFEIEDEDYMEKFAETAADVKDTVVSAAENVKETAADVKDTVVTAAENVKDTVSDAITDVKEAIEHAIEE